MDPEKALKNAIEKTGMEQAEAVIALADWLGKDGGYVPVGFRWPNLFFIDAAVWARRAVLYADLDTADDGTSKGKRADLLAMALRQVARRMDSVMDPKQVIA